MMQRLLIGAALAAALFLTWLAWDGWFYLQRGYSLGVALPGRPPSVSHIDFPAWRGVIHIVLWVATMSAIVGYVAGRSWASTAAWLTFSATLVIGIYDVYQYGTMGSPTSIWTILLILLFALLAKFGTLAPTQDA